MFSFFISVLGTFYFQPLDPTRRKYRQYLAYAKWYKDSLQAHSYKRGNHSISEESLIASLLQQPEENEEDAPRKEMPDMQVIQDPPPNGSGLDIGNLRQKSNLTSHEVQAIKEIHHQYDPDYYEATFSHWFNSSEKIVASISRHHQIDKIHFWGAAHNDRFRPHENSLFAIRRYQSPWLLQFRPPVPLPLVGDICKGTPPFLLIVVPSMPRNRMGRMAIRKTWGSVGHTGSWPHGKINAKVQILFVMGHEVTSPRFDPVIRQEIETYQDILQFDMTEDYRKLTIKMLGTLRWVNDNCKGLGFFLKADEDTFINVNLFVDFLLINQNYLWKTVLGTMYNAPSVRRWGRWSLSILEYPFERFPSYASGSSYLISGSAIDDLLKASEFFIPIAIEDAFITGILPKSAGIRRYHTPSMSMMGEVSFFKSYPTMCEFLSSRLAITDCTSEIFDRIWLAIQINYCRQNERWGLEDIGERWSFKRPSN
ncbi:Beta-1,3-galactosyltransferase 5 [Bulinus truncatus]|nr:Beta-1,3-galactosyltransferase 5 [Bulinus truncatus]